MNPLLSHFNHDTIPFRGWTMAGGYYQPKGRRTFRVWFPWKGRVIFKNKYLDGSQIYHEEQAKRVLEKIRAEVDQGIFDPAIWGSDRTLIFQNAWKVYQNQCRVGKNRMEARERIYQNLILPYFKNKSLKEIEEHHIKEWWNGVVNPIGQPNRGGFVASDSAWPHGSCDPLSAGDGRTARMTCARPSLPANIQREQHPKAPVGQCTPATYGASLRPYAPSTLRVIRATLRAFLNFHRVTRVKMLEFPKVVIPKKAIQWLKLDEQNKVFEFIPTQHKRVIGFIREYGCRPSEACNFNKNTDIDWQKREIIFRGRKNAKDNALSITLNAEILLKPTGKVTHLELAFCTLNGLKYTRQGLYHTWEEASKKANKKYGVPIVSLKNGTRHSLACQLLNQGRSIPEVARILGNTPSVVERSYGAISVQKTGEILDRVQIGEGR